jgi:hypothetical protein
MRLVRPPADVIFLGGLDPVNQSDAGRCLEGCELALHARGPDFRMPSAPAGGLTAYRIPRHRNHAMEEAQDEPLFCERAAGTIRRRKAIGSLWRKSCPHETPRAWQAPAHS